MENVKIKNWQLAGVLIKTLQRQDTSESGACMSGVYYF